MKLGVRWFPHIVDSGNLYPIYILKQIVVLASEPVGGRSRATELPCYLPRRRRPGMGDIATPPVRLCLSVRPSVTFSFRTVTQKRIDVFSRNFAGMCTMSWGCAV